MGRKSWLILLVIAVCTLGLEAGLIWFLGEAAVWSLLVINALAVALAIPARFLEEVEQRQAEKRRTAQARLARLRQIAAGDLDVPPMQVVDGVSHAEEAFLSAVQDRLAATLSLGQTAGQTARALQNDAEQLAHLHGRQNRILERVTQDAADMAALVNKSLTDVGHMSGGLSTIGDQLKTIESELRNRARSGDHLLERLSSLQIQLRDPVMAFESASEDIRIAAERLGTDLQEGAGDVGADMEAGAAGLQRSTGTLERNALEARRLVTELTSTQHALARARAELSQVAQNARSAGSSIESVQDIAKQTSLLALNASIIAAQAAGYGNQFAVVAEEIRELAARMAQATKDLAGTVHTLQASDAAADEDAGIAGEAILEDLGRALEQVLEAASDTREQARGLAGLEQTLRQRLAQDRRVRLDLVAQVEMIRKRVRELGGVAEAIRQSGQDAEFAAKEAGITADQLRTVEEQMQVLLRAVHEAFAAGEHATGTFHEVSSGVLGLASQGAGGMSVLEEGTRALASLSENSVDLAAAVFQHQRHAEGLRLPAPRPGGTMHCAYNPTAGLVFDKDRTFDVRHTQFTGLVLDGLVGFHEGTRVRPVLARSWSVSADGRTYLFHLRPNVRFHNGREFSAQDVRSNWLRALDPRIKSEGAWIFEMVEGVPVYTPEMPLDERARLFDRQADKIHIRPLDAHTLEVRLREPLSFFVKTLALDAAKIAAPECFDTMDKSPVGTGPYLLRSASASELVLVRNPAYCIEGQPLLDELRIEVGLQDTDRIWDRFQAGEYDFILDLPTGVRDEIRSGRHRGIALAEEIQLTTTFLTLGRFEGSGLPFEDVRVRRAMQHAIDVDRILVEVHGNAHVRARGFIPPGLFGHNPSRALPDYNVKKAKALLNEAGWPMGFEVAFMLGANRTRPGRDELLIQEMLHEVGISAQFETGAWIQYARQVDAGDAAPRAVIFRGGWTCDFPDPDNMLYINFHSKNLSVIHFRYANPEVDRQLEKARLSLNLAERQLAYREAESLILEDAPCVLLYHTRAAVAYRDHLRGVRVNLVPPLVREACIWSRT